MNVANARAHLICSLHGTSRSMYEKSGHQQKVDSMFACVFRLSAGTEHMVWYVLCERQFKRVYVTRSREQSRGDPVGDEHVDRVVPARQEQTEDAEEGERRREQVQRPPPAGSVCAASSYRNPTVGRTLAHDEVGVHEH